MVIDYNNPLNKIGISEFIPTIEENLSDEEQSILQQNTSYYSATITAVTDSGKKQTRML